MTPAEAISRIKGHLGNWTGLDITDWIVNEMNSAVRKLEKEAELPWFLFVDTEVDGSNLSTSANTETVALPSDFLREDDEAEITPLFVENTAEDDPWLPMYKQYWSNMKESHTGTGRPRYYDVKGSNIYLRKIPDATYTLRLLYYKKDSTITSGGSETLWLANAPDLIIAEAGYVVARNYLKDIEAAKTFNDERAEARRSLRDEIIMRREAGRLHEMGDA